MSYSVATQQITVINLEVTAVEVVYPTPSTIVTVDLVTQQVEVNSYVTVIESSNLPSL